MDIKRILTTVIGLPAVIAILVFGNNIIINVFFAIIAIIGIKEYFDAFEKTKSAKPVKWIGFVIAASISVLRLFHLSSSLISADEDIMNMMFRLVIVAFFIIFFHVLNSGLKTNVEDGAITMLGIIYVPVMIMFLPMLYASRLGKFLIWYVIICGWATDIFAYLAGKFFGSKKHKFSKISPNKSIEGCIFGAIRSCGYFSNIYSGL